MSESQHTRLIVILLNASQRGLYRRRHGVDGYALETGVVVSGVNEKS